MAAVITGAVAMDLMAMIPTEKYVWDPLRRYYPDGPPKDVLA